MNGRVGTKGSRVSEVTDKMALRGEQDQDSEWQIIPQEELKQSEYNLQRISKKHSTSNILITDVQRFQRLCKH